MLAMRVGPFKRQELTRTTRDPKDSYLPSYRPPSVK